MTLLETYLVQGHRHDLLRAAGSTRRFGRPLRRRQLRRLTVREQ